MPEAYDPRGGRAPWGSAVLGARGSTPLPADGAIENPRLAATEHALVGRGPFRPSKQGLKLAVRPVVPGPRVGRRRALPDPASFASIPRRLEVRDAVKDGAVERRQIFSARVWLHLAERWEAMDP